MQRPPDKGNATVQTQNRFLDDLAKVAASALGGVTTMRQEIETRLREQFSRLLTGMELVSRDEFNAVKAMAAEARLEQERLRQRLAQLEVELADARRKDAPAGGGPGSSSEPGG